MKKCWEMGTCCLCIWGIDCLKPVLYLKFSIMWDYKYFFVGVGHRKKPVVDLQAGSGPSRATHSSVVLAMSNLPSIPITRAILKAGTWGSNVLSRSSGWYALLNSGKAFNKLLRFSRAVPRSTCLADTQDKPHMLNFLAHENCHLPIKSDLPFSLVSPCSPCTGASLWINTLQLRSLKNNLWKIINNEFLQS